MYFDEYINSSVARTKKSLNMNLKIHFLKITIMIIGTKKLIKKKYQMIKCYKVMKKNLLK